MSQVPLLLSVIVPMRANGQAGRLLAEQVNRDLARCFGNPAPQDIRDRLDATGVIHFISACAIAPVDPDEPAIFAIEATGDGSELDIIAAINDALGGDLFPIVARACQVAHRGDLAGWMRKHSRQLGDRIPIGRRITGRSFSGVDDFSLREILGHSEIAAIVKEQVLAGEAGNPALHQPLEIVAAARRAVTRPDLKQMIDACKGQSAPSYVDRHNSPWIEKFVSSLRRGQTGSTLAIIAQIIGSLPAIIWALLAVFYAASVAMILAAMSGDSMTMSGALSAALLGFLPTLVLVGILAGLFAFLLRRAERANLADDSDPDPELVGDLLEHENPPNRPGKGEWVHNHMLAITHLQGGFFRRHIVLPLAFKFLKKRLTMGTMRKGHLGQMGSVHFARWLVPPGTRHFVFFSNYDGSWESYFEDFIIKAAQGVSAAWSSSKGFPETRFLLTRGAADGDRFKRFARRAMMPAPFWYSAYPELTAQQIRKNGLLVHGLANAASPTYAQAWLDMHGSSPRPEFDIEHEQIQGLAFGGCKQLNQSRVYALRFARGDAGGGENNSGGSGADAGAMRAQDWIRHASENRLSFGRAKPGDTAQYLALSASGIEAFGMAITPHASGREANGATGGQKRAGVEIDGLPGAFVHGMHHAGRNRALKDPDPANWDWGGGENCVDAVLLAYWRDAQTGDRLDQELRAEWAAHGIEVVRALDTHLTPYHANPDFFQEPFGFVDGISQPKVRGITARGENSPSIHDVEAGEFILGYRDNLGYFPSTPSIAGAADHKRILASTPDARPLLWPEFGGPPDAPDQRRDFGRNGSFLVIRQLAQNVEKFDQFVAQTAANAPPGSPQSDPDWTKSRMMGRWANGSSIALNPHHPGPMDSPAHVERESEFLLGKEDGQGRKCPLGAHVRRANPRDSLNSTDPRELEVSNRHRLLRRGRNYQIKNDDGSVAERGTMFMCLNANIERQFEFVQQSWLNAENFHGLSAERDPIAGNSGAVDGDGAPFDFTIPTASVPDRISGLSAFVELRGGGYFFMPSRRSLEFLSYL